MKRKIFSIAIATVALMASSAAFASSPSKSSCPARPCAGQTCSDSAQCNKCINPFEGLNLTQEQQTKIKELREKCANTRRDVVKEGKRMRTRVDSATVDMKRQAKADYLKSVKGILSAEQYVQFLENSFIQGREQRPAKGMKIKSERIRGKKGPRDAKQATDPMKAIDVNY